MKEKGVKEQDSAGGVDMPHLVGVIAQFPTDLGVFLMPHVLVNSSCHQTIVQHADQVCGYS